MKLIYINSGDSSVMEAQVLSLLMYFREQKKINDIILLQGYRNDNEKKILLKKINPYHLDVLWFRTYPNFTLFKLASEFALKKSLFRCGLTESTVIHVRGEMYGYFTKKILKNNNINSKLLVDIRGVSTEEIEEYYQGNTIFRSNKIRLYRQALTLLSRGVNITTVSEALKNYLVSKYSFEKENICVHPNIAGEQFNFDTKLRLKVRKKIGLKDDQVVAIASTGGGAYWQKDREVIEKLIKLNFQILNLSPHKVDIPGVYNAFVPFTKVPGYLSAADFAILWRDKSMVNFVASPAKFSEFSCSGLLVVQNDTVQIATDFITVNGSGLIVDKASKLTREAITNLLNKDRKSLAKAGRRKFGIENIALSYTEHYRKIRQN